MMAGLEAVPVRQDASHRVPSVLAGRIVVGIRRSPATLASIVILSALVLLGVTGSKLTPYNPMLPDVASKLLPPSGAHPFGTDELGRDVFSRVLFGARYSLMSATVVVGIAMLVGVPIGLVAGYLGGGIDQLFMRVADVFLAFPSLVLAMAVAAVFGPGLIKAIVAVAIVWWPTYARLMRAVAIAARGLLYVEAARSLGATHRRIIFRHLLPNSLAPLMVRASMDGGRAVLMTAGLSFIGLGAQPPLPEWGAMVAEGRDFFLNSWWYTTFPSACIYLVVLTFSFLGDGLRDILDPRIRDH